ncbi:hypothetical protein GCM10010885_07480 [Alicyclobacillus cellulosilyticus]|uniref:Stage II sporulation protein M n=1 Tax=Alicyclobacillus cellulosilyticus TaxID=1003997 RepID=A0A917K4L4_9BACL|nr:hypothetical protein GCM10010885_07480 [Alicyclobacillus cellulosilyticus]
MSHAGVPGPKQPYIQMRWFWGVAAGLLLAGYAAGLAWPQHFLPSLEPLVRHIQQLGSTLHRQNPVAVIWVLFLNNWITSVSLVVFGVGFGIFPAWRMWVNGLLMGVVNAEVAARLHVPWWKVAVFALLPHGWLEMAAVTCAGGLGLFVGYQVTAASADALRGSARWLRRLAEAGWGPVAPSSRGFSDVFSGRGAWPRWRERYFVISPPLSYWMAAITLALAAAAVVEAVVTPWLIHHFLSV